MKRMKRGREQILWWGYVHVNGSYQAKRYFSPLDIQEANESPFAYRAYGPFGANDREDALNKVRALHHEWLTSRKT